jgi:hypothetical protein
MAFATPGLRERPNCAIERALKKIRRATNLRDQEVSHSVPFVPVGWVRWLQRVEGTSLI